MFVEERQNRLGSLEELSCVAVGPVCLQSLLRTRISPRVTMRSKFLTHVLLIQVLLFSMSTSKLVESRGAGQGSADGDAACECESVARGRHESLLLIAEQHSTLGRKACAVTCLQRAVILFLVHPIENEDQDNARSLLSLQRLAKALYAVQNVERASAVLRLAVRLIPTSGDAHRGLGQLLRELGRPRAALSAFSRALNLQPQNPDYMFSLASLLQQLPSDGQHLEAAHDSSAVAGSRCSMYPPPPTQ